jgi:hypothetical protein
MHCGLQAICASSVDLTPLTPTAPMHCPSLTIGHAAFQHALEISGALRNEWRPALIMSS